MHRIVPVWALLLTACLALGARPASGAEGQATDRDEALLRSVGVSTDGPGLLAYFRLRGRGEAPPERLAALIDALGDKSPAASLKACGELAALGSPAVPALRQAAKDPDLAQTATLAHRCLQAVESRPGALSSAAARLLAARRPPGTAEALLAFLPAAEDEGVLEEVRLALIAVAHPDGKPDAALLRALEDESPIRRAYAIDALCQNGLTPGVVGRVPLRRLLQDPMPSVRLRAALALAGAHDAKAVSTLITLLTELSFDQARQAEDYLSELAGDQAPKTPLGADAAARQKCRDAWAAWWQASENGERLTEELRKRTLTEERRKKGETLIRQLGDGDFTVRQKAEAEIRAMGTPILAMLRKAVESGDLEVRRRARACLFDMEGDKTLPLSPVVPRLVALRKPAGGAEALLAYLPFADDEGTAAEVQRALNAVAFADGKPLPAVVRALADAVGIRRAAAAEALCLGGDTDHLPAARKLLSDADPAVRLKVALSLAGSRQREAVPVLIALIGEMPSAQSSAAEEYLHRVAGDRAPADLPSGDGEDNANRKKRHTAWADWWKANGERVALVDRYPASAAERYHGYTLLVQIQTNSVVELGTDHKPRWQLNGLLGPQDAEVVGPDRVLVAEHNGQRVTERNLRGDILWQKQIPTGWPIRVQRLRNGHTFIVCRNMLLEVDRAGREVYSINRPANDVVMARKMRDGQIVCVSTQRACQRLDTTGKEIKSFPLQMVMQNGVDILPNGHVLMSVTWTNKVQEYDADGKVVWDVNVMQPLALCRLPNGHTLVSVNQWPTKLVEVDPAGKQVNEVPLSTYAYRLRRR
jgi:HEAT repeat protein